VNFPNAGKWSHRLRIGFVGRMLRGGRWRTGLQIEHMNMVCNHTDTDHRAIEILQNHCYVGRCLVPHFVGAEGAASVLGTEDQGQRYPGKRLGHLRFLRVMDVARFQRA